MLQRRIEEASLNSWPSLQQILFDGWILRFSEGYTKRANSVSPIFQSSLDIDDKVDVCERLYREKKLRPIFRITPLASPPDLDQVLERRDYVAVARSLVLHLDLRSFKVQPAPSGVLRSLQVGGWLATYSQLREAPPGSLETLRRMLEAIPGECLFAALANGNKVVACGLGVLERDYFGLFDIITAQRERNKGYGTQLVSGLLRWAQENGASRAYLQVVAKNAPARHVYAKIGFQEAYHYWYRVREE